MFMVSVMYPSGVSFDHAYYVDTHLKMVKELWTPMGLRDLQVLLGQAGPDGAPAPYQLMANLSFDARSAFEAAASQHGAQIFADIPNFTEAKPVMQLSVTA